MFDVSREWNPDTSGTFGGARDEEKLTMQAALAKQTNNKGEYTNMYTNMYTRGNSMRGSKAAPEAYHAALPFEPSGSAHLPPSPPPPPTSPPGTFTSTASLETAVQAFNKDAASAIARYGPIADWDVSGVSDMNGLFSNLQNFNADISSWNTSGVTDMSDMFNVRPARALPQHP